MFDLDPWPEPKTEPLPPPGSRTMQHIRRFWRKLTRQHVN